MMAVEHVDSWRLCCDQCREEYEDGNGWSIFPDTGWAEDSAVESGWLIRPGLMLCGICSEGRTICRDEDNECLRTDVTEADDGWTYCAEHIEQGMDAPASQGGGRA